MREQLWEQLWPLSATPTRFVCIMNRRKLRQATWKPYCHDFLKYIIWTGLETRETFSLYPGSLLIVTSHSFPYETLGHLTKDLAQLIVCFQGQSLIRLLAVEAKLSCTFWQHAARIERAKPKWRAMRSGAIWRKWDREMKSRWLVTGSWLGAFFPRLFLWLLLSSCASSSFTSWLH